MIVNLAAGLPFTHSLVLYALTVVGFVIVPQSAGAITTTCCQVFGVVALKILYL